MLRVLIYLVLFAAAGWGLSQIADMPGEVTVEANGYVWKQSLLIVTCLLIGAALASIFGWLILSGIIKLPSNMSDYFKRRRQKRGLEALSTGMVAVASGDRAAAGKYATQARKALPNEPLTDLLRAQSAQLQGDRATARRIFDGMTNSSETEVLGLRGLFLEAQREGEEEAARQFADRAVRLNPKLAWATEALFDIQCKDKDWANALETLSIMRKSGTVEKNVAERRRAVLLTAQARDAEDTQMDTALALATEANKLAPDLIPAAEIAGRILASKGNTAKASKVLQECWKRGPHPDIAAVYAYARPGDSTNDRLKRVKQLGELAPRNMESVIAVASAAIEAKDWKTAREWLVPLGEEDLTTRVCTLMARLEEGENSDVGLVREWLARAVYAKPDPVWMADGVISENWEPVSPVTGELDAFDWKAPAETLGAGKRDKMIEQLQALQLTYDRPADGKAGGTQSDLADDVELTVTAASRTPQPKTKSDTRPSIGTDARSREERAFMNGRNDAVTLPAATAAASVSNPRRSAAKSDDMKEHPALDAPTASTASRGVTPGKELEPRAETSPVPTEVTPVASKVHKVLVDKDGPALVPVSEVEDKTDPSDLPEARVKEAKKRKNESARDDDDEPRIFIPPRAPDDPGTGTGTSEDPGTPLARFRQPPLKGSA